MQHWVEMGWMGKKNVPIFYNCLYPFTCRPHEMVKHTHTICPQFADELSVFEHFVGFAIKGLNMWCFVRFGPICTI